MEIAELIEAARRVVRPRDLAHDVEIGYVGAALVTPLGNVYTGCSSHAVCGLGFCAEIAAIAAMLTGGENEIEIIVAVSSDGAVLTPCGRCRETILHLNSRGFDTLVVVSPSTSVSLRELLPEHWLGENV